MLGLFAYREVVMNGGVVNTERSRGGFSVLMVFVEI